VKKFLVLVAFLAQERAEESWRWIPAWGYQDAPHAAPVLLRISSQEGRGSRREPASHAQASDGELYQMMPVEVRVRRAQWA